MSDTTPEPPETGPTHAAPSQEGADWDNGVENPPAVPRPATGHVSSPAGGTATESNAGDTAVAAEPAEPAEPTTDSSPATSAPSTTDAAPTTTAPAAPPASAAPIAPEPLTFVPATSEPAASEPAASGPAASEPAASGPAASEPAASAPAPSEAAAAADAPSAGNPAAGIPAYDSPSASGAPSTGPAETAPAIGAAAFAASDAPAAPAGTPSDAQTFASTDYQPVAPVYAPVDSQPAAPTYTPADSQPVAPAYVPSDAQPAAPAYVPADSQPVSPYAPAAVGGAALTAAAVASAPAPSAYGQPVAPIYVSAPIPPTKKSNRGFGSLIALVGAILFAIVYAIVVGVIGYIQKPTSDFFAQYTHYLATASFYIPVIFFAIGMILLVLIVNRASWWVYIVGGFFVGALVYFSVIGGIVVAEQGWRLTPVEFSRFVNQLWISPFPIAGGVVAREVSIWIGAWLAVRGRKLRARNAQAQEDYQQTLASGPQSAGTAAG